MKNQPITTLRPEVLTSFTEAAAKIKPNAKPRPCSMRPYAAPVIQSYNTSTTCSRLPAVPCSSQSLPDDRVRDDKSRPVTIASLPSRLPSRPIRGRGALTRLGPLRQVTELQSSFLITTNYTTVASPYQVSRQVRPDIGPGTDRAAFLRSQTDVVGDKTRFDRVGLPVWQADADRKEDYRERKCGSARRLTVAKRI
ncbi:hypothetical protein Bbelb_381010 [Branchiostoma belcheri]|nr:hypothetical protein Bbelb_381010 [Branchiostoma belcheri]